MANTTLKKVSVRLKLENGTDADGNMKYVNLSLGSLSKTVGIVEMTQVSEITAA